MPHAKKQQQHQLKVDSLYSQPQAAPVSGVTSLKIHH